MKKISVALLMALVAALLSPFPSTAITGDYLDSMSTQGDEWFVPKSERPGSQPGSQRVVLPNGVGEEEKRWKSVGGK